MAGGLAMFGALPGLSACSRNSEAGNTMKSLESGRPFGLQLYTLRTDMPGDPKGVLRKVSEFGYKEIESYEGPMGMYWGMTPREFKTYMDELGMEIVSSHCNILQDFERKASEAASIGMKYLVCPWIGPQQTLDDYKRYAELFNQCGETCKKEGIRFAYHNHAYTFEEMDGAIPQDILMQDTDPALVDHELDIYWVVTAGHDPIEWMREYPGRFTLSHIKDREKDAPHGEGNASTTLGTGSIDYEKIIAVALETGMKYLIVEQEKYDGTTPLESVRDNAIYMKNLLSNLK